jgi:hypothetical protein
LHWIVSYNLARIILLNANNDVRVIVRVREDNYGFESAICDKVSASVKWGHVDGGLQMHQY